MLKKADWQVLLGCLVLLVGLKAARCGEIEAWDAPVPAAGGEFQTDQRAIWKPLGIGETKHCAVLDNGKLLLAAIPGREGAIVCTKAHGVVKGTTVRLSFFDSQGKVVAPVQSIRLADRSAAEGDRKSVV